MRDVMIETLWTAEAIATIADRLPKVDALVRRERTEGLEVDWSEVAELLESIERAAANGARNAWLVAGEEYAAALEHADGGAR